MFLFSKIFKIKPPERCSDWPQFEDFCTDFEWAPPGDIQLYMKVKHQSTTLIKIFYLNEYSVYEFANYITIHKID